MHSPETHSPSYAHDFPVSRGLWIPQVVPILKKLVGLRIPLVLQMEEAVEILVTLSPTTVTGLSPASLKANLTQLLPTLSGALCTLPLLSLSTQTPAETTDYLPNSALTPVSLLDNKLRLPSAPTQILRILVSVTTC